MNAQIKKNLMKKARGQGMTEYIIIVALIAIAAIGVITVFGDNIRQLFGMSSDALAGNQAQDDRRGRVNAAEKRKMKDFAESKAGEF